MIPVEALVLVAQTTETTDVVGTVVTAYKSGGWLAAAAAGVMALIGLGKKTVFKKVPKKWLPVTTIATSVVGCVATALASGQDVVQAVGAGVTVGLAAVGLHEAHTKTREKKVEEKPAG